MKCIYCEKEMIDDSDEYLEYYYCLCGAIYSPDDGFESREDLIRIVGRN